MKKLLSLLILLIAFFQFSFAQDQQPETGFRPVLLSSLHVLPADTLNEVYYTYRITYNRLVFEKTGDTYTSRFTVSVEVFDSSGDFIVRNSSDKKIILDNFEETNSRNKYVEGLIEFKLGKGQFNIIPVLTDQNSGRELKLKPAHLVTTSPDESSILNPLIVDAKSFNCDNMDYSTLTNFEENFPFEAEEFNLVIPVTDTTIKQLKVIIVNDQDTVYSGMVSESNSSNISLQNCGGKIIVTGSELTRKARNFIIKNFSNKLNVGNILISVYRDKNISTTGKPDKTFQKAVTWYNKPFSLTDPEAAIKSLKYMEKDSVISRLLKEKSDNYQKVLFEYWKKYDPSPQTNFNELMSEYYQRIDYASMNFTSIGGKNGIDTDRGKILILFGKPIKIERASNQFGKIVETWVYENPQRKFIFVDQKGTGDFSLIKG